MDTTNEIIEGDIVEIAPEQQAIIDELTDPDNVYARAVEEVELLRRSAYRDEADPLFFYAERGKGQKQAWLDKIAEIDARFPYPEKPVK